MRRRVLILRSVDRWVLYGRTWRFCYRRSCPSNLFRHLTLAVGVWPDPVTAWVYLWCAFSKQSPEWMDRQDSEVKGNER